MTIWIVGENSFVDIVVEPHLAQTYTICANDPAELSEIAQIAPQPIFKTVHGCKFEWAVHPPMNRVLPEAWQFLDHYQAYRTERLEKPISPHPTEWYWEACKIYDDEGHDLPRPEGIYGTEFMRDPAELLTELEDLWYQDISLVPMFESSGQQDFLDRSAEEWDVHPDEWEEIDESEEGDL